LVFEAPRAQRSVSARYEPCNFRHLARIRWRSIGLGTVGSSDANAYANLLIELRAALNPFLQSDPTAAVGSQPSLLGPQGKFDQDQLDTYSFSGAYPLGTWFNAPIRWWISMPRYRRVGAVVDGWSNLLAHGVAIPPKLGIGISFYGCAGSGRGDGNSTAARRSRTSVMDESAGNDRGSYRDMSIVSKSCIYEDTNAQSAYLSIKPGQASANDKLIFSYEMRPPVANEIGYAKQKRSGA